MESGRLDTAQLLKRWHEGDEEALGKLLERDMPWIERRVRMRLGGLLRAKAETQDFVQEAALEFLRYGPRFLLADTGQFRALLARIVENAIRAQHDRFTARRRALHKERPLPGDSVLRLDASIEETGRPSRDAEAEEWKALVRLALELLDEDDREVIVSREWEGHSFGQIGAQLGITEDAARMRHSRALSRLAHCIQRVRAGKISEVLGETSESGEGSARAADEPST